MAPIYRIPRDTIVIDHSDVLPLAGELNWGIPKLDIARLRSICDGTDIIAGVIDTGVDDTHADLVGQILAKRDFSGSGHAGDRNGHGSHCSGTIVAKNPNIGVAPGAKLVHGKGLSDGGSGGGRGIADAMQFCVDMGATVLSMSLGSSGLDPYIDRKGQELTEKGILIFAAAGNSGGNTPAIDFPGRLPWAISVAAVDPSLVPASFSSAGEGIETAAPGTNIWSCRTGGGYTKMSGTSMATPFAAAVFVLERSCRKKLNKPFLLTADVQKILQSDSVDVGAPGVDRRTGPGVISTILLANNYVDAPPAVSA